MMSTAKNKSHTNDQIKINISRSAFLEIDKTIKLEFYKTMWTTVIMLLLLLLLITEILNNLYIPTYPVELYHASQQKKH